jgi:4-oxalocrotonate tautomerase
MPTCIVEWAAGRTLEQKAELVERITAVLTEVAKCQPEAVRVIIHDNPPENTAVGGKFHHLTHASQG